MKLFFLVIFLVVSFDAYSAPSQVLDLKKSIQFALNNSPAFNTLKQNLTIAELEKKSAKAKFLPSLDLTAVHGVQDSSPRTNGPWGSELRLDLTESLYDNGVSQINYELSSYKKNQADLLFQERQNKLSLDIVTQFLTYSLNMKLLEVQDRQVKLVKKQYDSISREYHQGLKTKNDFLRFKTQVSRYEIDLVNSKNAVLKSKEELRRLIGIDLHSKDEVEFVPLVLGGNTLVPEVALRVEDQLQYKSVQVQKEINKLDAEVVRKKNLPEFFVSSGVSYGSSQYLKTGQSFTDNDVLSWNALLTVKYNFWDWGIRANDRDVALAKNKILNNGLDEDLLLLKSNINQFMINIDQVKKNFELAKELLTLEKNNISFIEQEYKSGQIRYLDLIAGLNDLTDAEVRFYSASSELNLLNFTSLYYQGKLYEELIK